MDREFEFFGIKNKVAFTFSHNGSTPRHYGILVDAERLVGDDEVGVDVAGLDDRVVGQLDGAALAGTVGGEAEDCDLRVDAEEGRGLGGLNSDFRKLMFKAPAGHELESKVSYIDVYVANYLPDYAAIKFRPNDGVVDDYKVGSASAYPIMRIEEMFFIEAEAAEHIAPGEGIALLTDFMTTYRDANYMVATDVDAIDEIVFQKRVELWGEGLSFFDYKRLNMPVKRGYEGSNWQETARLFFFPTMLPPFRSPFPFLLFYTISPLFSSPYLIFTNCSLFCRQSHFSSS